MKPTQISNLTNPYHSFRKCNNVTLRDKLGYYDVWKCKKCGIEGKRRGFNEELLLIKSYKEELIKFCIEGTPTIDTYIGKTIRITNCNATWAVKEGFLPGTHHTICIPAERHVNGDRGVWIMGNDEPYKLLFSEFVLEEKVKLIRTKFPTK